MKKVILIIVIFSLLVGLAHAQLQPGRNETQLSDTVPSIVWDSFFEVVNHPSKKKIQLNEFKDKILILDFWATWCKACIPSLHELDSLNPLLPDDFSIVLVTKEDDIKVTDFLKRQRISLPSIVNSKSLGEYFPYYIIPHQIWIKDGVVRAIVNGRDATISNLEKIKSDPTFYLHTKKDLLDFSDTSPLWIYTERLEVSPPASFLLTPYLDGIGNGNRIRNAGNNIISNFLNMSIINIYTGILETRNNRVRVNSVDIDRFDCSKAPLDKRKVYSFQTILPANSDKRRAKESSLSYLDLAFNFKLDSQLVDTECYVISKAEGSKLSEKEMSEMTKLKVGTERGLHTFIDVLNFSVVWTPNQPIFVDESGYSGSVFTGSYPILQKDIEKLSLYLKSYGLKVTQEKRPIKMYTINDLNSVFD